MSAAGDKILARLQRPDEEVRKPLSIPLKLSSIRRLDDLAREMCIRDRDTDRIGVEAARRLIARVNGQSLPPSPVFIPTRLLPGGTVGQIDPPGSAWA